MGEEQSERTAFMYDFVEDKIQSVKGHWPVLLSTHKAKIRQRLLPSLLAGFVHRGTLSQSPGATE